VDFLWPGFLLLLGLIPLSIIGFVLAQRRRRKFVVRYSSLSLIRAAQPQQSRLRKYVPPALFIGALSCLALAMSRPVSIVNVPSDRTTIILAIDVSRSMCSTDITPNRLMAAEKAAIDFIKSQKPSTQIGLVAFSGFAEMVQTPTTDREALQAAIEGLVTGRRTAIGSAIAKSLDVIAEIDPSVPSVTDAAKTGIEPAPLPNGAYSPHIIVVLTDGASNAGTQPVDAAQLAADRGIRVYTIGFGTANGGEMPNCNPGAVGREPGGQGGFGGFGGGFGGGFRRGIDEDTLREVAALTDAEYYSAESVDELNKAFTNLPVSIISRSEITEISALFAAGAGLLTILAVALGLKWQPMPG
jgi:Ca-activated chloride channel homolog